MKSIEPSAVRCGPEEKTRKALVRSEVAAVKRAFLTNAPREAQRHRRCHRTREWSSRKRGDLPRRHGPPTEELLGRAIPHGDLTVRRCPEDGGLGVARDRCGRTAISGSGMFIRYFSEEVCAPNTCQWSGLDVSMENHRRMTWATRVPQAALEQVAAQATVASSLLRRAAGESRLFRDETRIYGRAAHSPLFFSSSCCREVSGQPPRSKEIGQCRGSASRRPFEGRYRFRKKVSASIVVSGSQESGRPFDAR